MPIPHSKDLFDLTADMYEAAALVSDPRWQSIYERLSELMSSGPGSLHFMDKSRGKFDAFADTNQPGFIDRFNREYFEILPWREKILNLRPGKTFFRSRECPDRIYLNSRLYRDHFKKLGIHYVMHHCLFDSAYTAAGITFTRPKKLRTFGSDEITIFSEVSGHLVKAIGLFVKCRQAAADQRLYIDAWEAISQGIVVLTSSGKIVFTNTAAEKYLADGRITIGKHGVIACNDEDDTAELRHLIRGSLQTAPKVEGAFGGSMALSRHADADGLRLTVTPFRENAGSGMSRKYALLLIDDPLGMRFPEAALQNEFRLTPAEVRLANMLADGNSISESAELLGISKNTARTHLKRIFSKTATNRQSALVKLILSRSKKL